MNPANQPVVDATSHLRTALNRGGLRLFAVVAWMVFVALAAAPLQELSPSEERGKEIYVRGKSPSGHEVIALMGDADIEVPATVLPCVNCHGPDGRGRPEGGVKPSDIRWQTLTKPYGVRRQNGREHPPYTLGYLKRAIGMTIDPAGNRLNPAMPRYRMSIDDMADLLAYCRKLGHESDPGLSADTLRIGTLLPPSGGRMDAIGKTIESVLLDAFAKLNNEGGIYGRELQLVTMRLPAKREETREKIEKFLTEERIFALVGAFVAAAEDEIAAIAREREIPLVGPFTLHPQLGTPVNRYVFYLFSGLKTQARVLFDFMSAKQGEEKPAAFIYPRAPRYESVAQAVSEQARKAGWKTVSVHSYPPLAFEAGPLAEELAVENVAAVFFLDTGERAAALLASADRLGWYPRLLLPGSMAGRAIFQAPAGFKDLIFLSFPTLPRDQTPHRDKNVPAAAKHALPAGHRFTQLSTLASAEILEEGLKRAGRELSREKLIEALEGLYEFDTGLTPLISYGPNRRVGARGAYLAVVDLERKTLVPTSQFIEVR